MDLVSIKDTITSLNDLAWKQRYSNTIKALELSRRSLSLAKENMFSSGIAMAQLNISFCNFILSNPDDKILENIISSQKYFEENNKKEESAKALNLLGNVYENLGDFNKGMECCNKALILSREINNREIEGDTLSNLGTIFSRISDYEKALKAYLKSLKIREELQDNNAAASSLNLIGRTFSLQGNFESALEFYSKSLKLREEKNDRDSIPWTYLGMASVYEKMDRREEALQTFQKAIELNSPTGDKRCNMHCYLGIGRIYHRNGEPEKSIQNLKLALEIANRVKSKPVRYEIHSALVDAYEKSGNISEAFSHFRIFHQLKEEVLNAESSNRLKNQQISFAVEKSEKEAEIFRLHNVELRKAYAEIEEKNKDITGSITYAKRIQQAILPEEEMISKYLNDFFIFFKPKDIVSGDFYWFHYNTELKSVLFATADCTGHGVPGAFMSMIGTDILNHIVLEKKIFKPSDILTELDKGIRYALKQDKAGAESKDGMEMALISWQLAVDSLQSKKINLQYAGAMRSLIIVRNNSFEEIKADKISLGGNYLETEAVFTNKAISLEKGDSLYMYSDGFGDQFGGEKTKKFSTRKLKELLLSISQKPMPEQKKILEETFESWKGRNDQMDDVLVVGLRV